MSQEFKTRDEKLDWIQRLVNKDFMVRKAQAESGKNASAALNEVGRQLKQVVKENTITKSGEGD